MVKGQLRLGEFSAAVVADPSGHKFFEVRGVAQVSGFGAFSFDVPFIPLDLDPVIHCRPPEGQAPFHPAHRGWLLPQWAGGEVWVKIRRRLEPEDLQRPFR